MRSRWVLDLVLDPVLTLLDASGAVLASNDDSGETRDSLIVYTPAADGTLLLRMSDALNTGSPRHVYRLTIGEVPYLTSVYPLGRRTGSALPVRIEGANLGAVSRGTVGTSSPDSPELAPVEVATPGGQPLNRLQIALGRYPELDEVESQRDVPLAAQRVVVPATVNGRLHHTDGTPDQDVFRFTAARGQRVVISVAANRLDSPLDPVIDVLDARGREVPRAVLRPIWETTID